MNALSPYALPRDHREDPNISREQIGQPTNQPFVSLLELVGEIYKVLLHSFIYHSN
jgi:nuclear pore complex protein Nup205